MYSLEYPCEITFVFVYVEGRYISHRYNIPLNQIWEYFHHHPSFYQLHIHFTMASYHPQCSLGQTHLMEDMTENVKIVDLDYYTILRGPSHLDFKENSRILTLLNKTFLHLKIEL